MPFGLAGTEYIVNSPPAPPPLKGLKRPTWFDPGAVNHTIPSLSTAMCCGLWEPAGSGNSVILQPTPATYISFPILFIKNSVKYTISLSRSIAMSCGSDAAVTVAHSTNSPVIGLSLPILLRAASVNQANVPVSVAISGPRAMPQGLAPLVGIIHSVNFPAPHSTTPIRLLICAV